MPIKKHIFVIALLLGVSLYSQSIERQVIGSSGATFVSTTMTLDYTVGDIAIYTVQDEGSVLTQGFHQPPYAIAVTPEPPIDPTELSLYPNPTSGLVMIEGDTVNTVEVYTVTGQRILQTNLPRFDISHLRTGVYIARIETTSKTFVKRIIKD